MIIKKEDYQKIADIIRSDQMLLKDIFRIFQENPDFFKWYTKNMDHIGGWFDEK
tara:strand:+ start:1915 stop:2076 length:162 start_codon:yes stop_codon:yes gene_type:complete